jgi:glycosyltransferase involved in cell wall biosynthesis/GT2 family glycosyltransferase
MFSEYGHEVTVFLNDYDLPEEVAAADEEGIRVVRFRPEPPVNGPDLGHLAVLSLAFSEVVERFVRDEGAPDVLEYQDYLGIGYFLGQKKLTLWPGLRCLNTVVTLHSPMFLCDLVNQCPVYNLPAFWTGEMEKSSIRAADLVISPSRYLLNELASHLAMEDLDCRVVRNPFRLGSGVALPAEPVRRSQTDFAYVGRLEHRKGVLPMLRYFDELWRDGCDARLQMIGGDTYFHPRGKMMSEIISQRYGERFASGNLIWEGALPPRELYGRIRRARAVVVPSIFENFPYTVVEAMALGVITLASDSGGQSEIVENGRSGLLFSHDKAGDFAQQAHRILEMSEGEMTSLGDAARRRVEEWCSYPAVYAAKLEALESLRDKKAGRRSFPFIRSRPRPESSGEAPRQQAGLLSIVVPYYNMGAYLKETLTSLTQVRHEPREIIVVNDGCDDLDSIAVLYEAEREFPVQVLNKTNSGPAAARNAGALQARGEWLAFLDADDLVDPDYYGMAVEMLQAYDNVSFVGCWAQYFDGAQDIWPTWNPEPPYILVHNTMNSSGLVFRRRDFLLHGRNDPAMVYGMEDYDSVLGMVEGGCHGVVVPRPLFHYRVRGGSRSRQLSRDSLLYLHRLLAAKYRSLYAEYAPEVVNLLNANGPGYLFDNPTLEPPASDLLHSISPK